MSRVYLASSSNKKWMAALSATAIAGMALMACLRQEQGGGAVTAYHGGQAAHAQAGQEDLAGAAQSIAAADFKVLAAQQQAAAEELARQPDLKPVVGVVNERPSYVSRLEWLMMKGVAQQQALPDQELNHLVNFLRFNKQQELWESLPRDAASAARRQGLAQALLDDLPVRLRSGDFDLPGALQLQTKLLIDAEPDVQQRALRSQRDAQRLQNVAQEIAATTTVGQAPP